MKTSFITLTQSDGSPVIVGLANIGMIEPYGETETRIFLNFPRGSDMYPKTVDVNEDFATVKSLLGL